MGQPLDAAGRELCAHQTLQVMILEHGIAIGECKKPIGQKVVWEPDPEDIALLQNLMIRTPGLEDTLRRLYHMQRDILSLFKIDEEKFKKSPWYMDEAKRKEVSQDGH